jgi:hypothetical protein
MPRPRSIVFGSLFVGGLLVIAWFEYYPASPMLATIGLPGPRANSGLACGSYYQQTALGRLPMRRMVCRVPTSADPWNKKEVRMDALNRQIANGMRTWTVPDSGQWKREQDSVASALTRLGGHEFGCARNPFTGPTMIRAVRFWSFPTYYVRFVAQTWDQYPYGRLWLLQLDAYPTLPLECGKNAGFGLPRENICSADGVFRVPLPGRRELCVKL